MLVKLNQIGTLTETLDAVDLRAAQRLGRGHQPPQRRDRGHDDRRPRGRHRHRPDQDAARRRARSASRSTTACCASRRSWAAARSTRAAPRSRQLGDARRSSTVAAALRAVAAVRSRFIDRGAMFAGWVGIGMAHGHRHGVRADHRRPGDRVPARADRGRADRRLRQHSARSAGARGAGCPANAAYAGLVTASALALMYGVLRLLFVYADSGYRDLAQGGQLACRPVLTARTSACSVPAVGRRWRRPASRIRPRSSASCCVSSSPVVRDRSDDDDCRRARGRSHQGAADPGRARRSWRQARLGAPPASSWSGSGALGAVGSRT